MKGTDYGKSDYTPIKQRHLRRIVRARMSKVAYLIAKGSVPEGYLYFDLHAGPGIDDVGDWGSPKIILEEARAHDVIVEAHLFEQNAQTALRLRRVVQPYDRYGDYSLVQAVDGGDWCAACPGYSRCDSGSCESAFTTVEVHAARCEDDLLRRLNFLSDERDLDRAYGLMYVDPTGGMPWKTVHDAIASLPHVDLLINMGGSIDGRVRTSTGREMRVTDYLDLCRKRRWYVRRPIGKHLWTMVLGTNDTGIVKIPRYVGMEEMTGPKGQWYMAKIGYSNNERRQADFEFSGQLPLF